MLNGRPSMGVTLPPAGVIADPGASISALLATAEQHIMTPDPARHLDLAITQPQMQLWETGGVPACLDSLTGICAVHWPASDMASTG